MDDNNLYDDMDGYDDEFFDHLDLYFPFWFVFYGKYYKSRNRRYFIERKDKKDEE